MALTDIDGVRLADNAFTLGKNLVINGSMQVAQRGTSSSSAGYGSVDRFTSEWDVISITQSQQSLSSGAPYVDGFRNFLRLTNTSASSATNVYAQVDHRIEAQNIANSAWNYVDNTSYITCSFWVRASLAGTYYAQYRDIDAGDLQINKAFTVAADTWTKVTHTIPGNASCVFNNDNGNGFQITFTLYYGTDFTDSSVLTDTWYIRSSTTYLPDFTQNWANTASATFDITGVQLEAGSVATPFERRSYGQELALCQRYCYVARASDGGDNYTRYALGDCLSIAGIEAFINLPVEMRVKPTSITTTGTASNYAIYSAGSVFACTSVPVIMVAATPKLAAIQAVVTSGSLTIGRAGQLLSNNNTTSYLIINAEL